MTVVSGSLNCSIYVLFFLILKKKVKLIDFIEEILVDALAQP